MSVVVLAVDHMRFMHHVINCSWLITVLAQCAVISQREASQAFTWDKKQQQQLVLHSGKLFVVPHWGGLCRGRSFNDNIKILLMNVCTACTPYSHDQTLSKSK